MSMGDIDFKTFAEKLRPALAQALRQHVCALFCELPGAMRGRIADAVTSGKFLRGSLLCAVSDAFGGASSDSLPGAVAIECIHAASLLHDDYIDQDMQRRGRPAVWVVDGAREAVLIADVILADALRALAALGGDSASVGGDAIARLARGALVEGQAARADASHDRYEEIIRLKTGSLFAAAVRLGAIAAAAPRDVQDAGYRYGMLIGEAYQIADDLADLESCSALPDTFRPLVRHFLPEHADAREPGRLERLAIQPLLRERMIVALAARRDRALAILRELPARGCVNVLPTAADDIVSAQRKGLHESNAVTQSPFSP